MSLAPQPRRWGPALLACLLARLVASAALGQVPTLLVISMCRDSALAGSPPRWEVVCRSLGLAQYALLGGLAPKLSSEDVRGLLGPAR